MNKNNFQTNKDLEIKMLNSKDFKLKEQKNFIYMNLDKNIFRRD